MTIEFIKGAQLEEILAGAGKSLVEEHAGKLRESGVPEPLIEPQAKAKAGSDIQGMFEIIAGRIAGFKATVLKSMGELQLKLMDAYEALFRGEKPDMERFERTLREMDELMNTLGADAGETVDKMPAPPEAAKPTAPALEPYAPIEPPPGPRPASKPPGEPPPRGIVDGKPEKLDKNNITAEQRRFFEQWRRNAGENNAELDRMRYERNRVGRRNEGMPDYKDPAEYEKVVKRSNVASNRKEGTAASDRVRGLVAKFLGKELASGDKNPTVAQREIPNVLGRDGKPVTTRPDSFVMTPDGQIAEGGVIHEHKLYRGGEGGIVSETPQTRAERQLAIDTKSQHVVSISSEVPPKLNEVPPVPRPSPTLAKDTRVVFVDEAAGRVTHEWVPGEGWKPVGP